MYAFTNFCGDCTVKPGGMHLRCGGEFGKLRLPSKIRFYPPRGTSGGGPTDNLYLAGCWTPSRGMDQSGSSQ
jgi:hypothetical protein